MNGLLNEMNVNINANKTECQSNDHRARSIFMKFMLFVPSKQPHDTYSIQ